MSSNHLCHKTEYIQIFTFISSEIHTAAYIHIFHAYNLTKGQSFTCISKYSQGLDLFNVIELSPRTHYVQGEALL